MQLSGGNYGRKCSTIEEKALYDKLHSITPIRSIKEIKQMLFEDLRIDEDMFAELDKEFILKIAPLYRSSNLNYLAKLIKKEYLKT